MSSSRSSPSTARRKRKRKSNPSLPQTHPGPGTPRLSGPFCNQQSSVPPVWRECLALFRLPSPRHRSLSSDGSLREESVNVNACPPISPIETMKTTHSGTEGADIRVHPYSRSLSPCQAAWALSDRRMFQHRSSLHFPEQTNPLIHYVILSTDISPRAFA